MLGRGNQGPWRSACSWLLACCVCIAVLLRDLDEDMGKQASCEEDTKGDDSGEPVGADQGLGNGVVFTVHADGFMGEEENEQPAGM